MMTTTATTTLSQSPASPPLSQPQQQPLNVAFQSPYSSQKRQAAREERKEHFEEMHDKVIKEGFQTAAVFAVASSTASLALWKGYGPNRLVSLYAKLRPTYRPLLPTLITTAAFFTQTDTSAMRIDREFAEKYSITRTTVLPSVDVDQEAPLARFSWTQEGVKAWAIKKRFEIVGCLWVGTMGAALFYNFSRGDISTAQKLINARMTAQSAALFGIISFGLASNITERRQADNKD